MPAPASSRTSYRSRRRFFVPNKRHLSLTSSLLLFQIEPASPGFNLGFLLRAKSAQLRFRQQPEAIAENCVRSLAPPSKSEAHWLRICFFRFFCKVRSASFPATARGYCRKLRSLPCASFQIRSPLASDLFFCFFCKVRSTAFPATAYGYCRKLRSLPRPSFQIRSTWLRICFFRFFSLICRRINSQ